MALDQAAFDIEVDVINKSGESVRVFVE